MTSGRTTRPVRRWWSVLAALALVVAVLGPQASVLHAVAGTDDAAIIDLAILFPGLPAITDAGLDDLVTTAGTQVDPGDRDGSAIPDDAWDAGLVRVAESYWADERSVLASFGGSPFAPATSVRFYAWQFADDDAAETGFGLLESGDEDLDVDLDLGDESEASEVPPGEDDAGENVSGVDVSARVGPLAIGVTVATTDASDVAGDELDVATGLLEAFVERVESYRELPGAGPGLETVRFGSGLDATVTNGYSVVDGEAWTRLAVTGESDRDDLEAEAVEAGAIDRYEFTSLLPADPATGVAYYYLTTRTTAWEDDDAAVAFIDGYAELASGEGSAGLTDAAVTYDVSPLGDAPEPGDTSVAVVAEGTDTDDVASAVAWADGASTYEVILQVYGREASTDALYAAVAAQQDCLADGDCWQFRALPDELADDLAAPAADDTGTPVAADPGTPTASTGTPGADTSGPPTSWTFEAGFSFAWDGDQWSFEEGNEDVVSLTREDPLGQLQVSPGTDEIPVDPEDCIAYIEDDLLPEEESFEDLRPAEGADGDALADSDGDVAWAAFDLTLDGLDVRAWAACVAVVPGDSVAGFLYLVVEDEPREDLPTELREVIDSIEVTG